eukprot:Sspe_Gene.44270::Locus_21692_Transcript_1_3_Confidence_0.333_Length_1277::g.44270::m.44270
MEGEFQDWEYFRFILRAGGEETLHPEAGYRLHIRHVAVQDAQQGDRLSLYWQPATGGVRKKPRRTGDDPHLGCTFCYPHVSSKLDMVFCQPVTLSLRGPPKLWAVVWACYELQSQEAFLRGTSAENEEERDVPPAMDGGTAANYWRKDPRWKSGGRHHRDTNRAPYLEPVESHALRATRPYIIPSSSPERSVSQSDEERGYIVHIPSLPPPESARLHALESSTPFVAAVLCVLTSAACLPCPFTEVITVPRVTRSPHLTPRPGGLRPQLRGVLKARRKAHSAGKLSPIASAKKVKFNPRSPDVRFITPPLSAVHRLFPDGMLDLGVPLLSTMRGDTSTSSFPAVADLDTVETTKPVHRPFQKMTVTPANLRPTVIM